MFADERKAKILDIILQQGNAYISELSKQFQVSDETIRRDLAELSKDNKIVKVHGGAIAVKRPLREERYDTRIKQNSEAKKKIGRYAANLISDGDVISFDYGVTTEEIARFIYNVKNITVLTNSFTIATILIKKIQAGDFTGKILFIGGEINVDTAKASGEVTLAFLNRFMTDKAFVTVTSISHNGIMMWNETEGEFSATLCKRASETYIVADSSKFDKDSFYKFLDFEQVDCIITDDENEISEETKDAILSSHARLKIVKD